MKTKIVHAALFGIAVGDALGVPVEFKSRESLKENPVIDMREFGSHNQPAGTWSDDSSLTFCLAEMLYEGYNIEKLANRFLNWRNYGYWSAFGKVFDIGIATNMAIQSIEKGVSPLLAGARSEKDNGNGSLMRILPLAFYIKDLNIEKRFDLIKDVSSITHAHIRSILACFIYIEMVLQILKGNDKWNSYNNMQKIVLDFLNNNAICSQGEMDKFHRILKVHSNPTYDIIPINQYSEDEISSSGYVIDSLEASFWCFLNFNSYEESVLKAVNLGRDTDTTAAITGGLARLYYGYEAIPKDWINVLARKDDINDLCNRLEKKIF